MRLSVISYGGLIFMLCIYLFLLFAVFLNYGYPCYEFCNRTVLSFTILVHNPWNLYLQPIG